MLALTKELPCSERGGAWGPWFSTSRGLGKVQYIPYQLRESTWRTLYVQQRRREAEGRLVAAWACCGSGRRSPGGVRWSPARVGRLLR